MLLRFSSNVVSDEGMRVSSPLFSNSKLLSKVTLALVTMDCECKLEYMLLNKLRLGC